MRATLNFTLPDDGEDFAAALAGKEAIAVLRDVARRLRMHLRNSDSPADIAEYALALIPDKLLEDDL